MKVYTQPGDWRQRVLTGLFYHHDPNRSLSESWPGWRAIGKVGDQPERVAPRFLKIDDLDQEQPTEITCMLRNLRIRLYMKIKLSNQRVGDRTNRPRHDPHLYKISLRHPMHTVAANGKCQTVHGFPVSRTAMNVSPELGKKYDLMWRFKKNNNPRYESLTSWHTEL